MKYLTQILLLFLSSVSTIGVAQETIEYGVKAGYARSSMITEEHGAFGLSKSGFVVGAYSKIPLKGQLYFQPEMLFIQKGDIENKEKALVSPSLFKLDTPIYYEGLLKTTTSAYYVSIPLNLLYKVNDSFGITLGGEPSLFINESTRAKFTGIGYHFDRDQERGIKRFDFGLNLGLQATVGAMHLELRYTRGVLNINDDALASDHINSSLQVTLGYRIIKKKGYY